MRRHRRHGKELQILPDEHHSNHSEIRSEMTVILPFLDPTHFTTLSPSLEGLCQSQCPVSRMNTRRCDRREEVCLVWDCHALVIEICIRKV
jgi:hypothetical protein